MEAQERPDKYQLCEERGITAEHPRYAKLVQYAGATGWITSQYESKTFNTLSEEAHSTLADVLITGVFIDEATEEDTQLSWGETLELIEFPDNPGAIKDGETGTFWSTLPVELSTSLSTNLGAFKGEQLERLNFSWDAMLLSMYEHRLAVTTNSHIREIIGARVMEAVSMSELFCSVMFEDGGDYNLPFFMDWLSAQLAAGNLLDSILDYREDLTAGHRELSALEKSLYIGAASSFIVQYLTHPMTDKGDRRFMLKSLKSVCFG